ncbi:unnamed protein product, partial [Amoebophrya sp. A25]|eukprot:GSA25T00023308001.1
MLLEFKVALEQMGIDAVKKRLLDPREVIAGDRESLNFSVEPRNDMEEAELFQKAQVLAQMNTATSSGMIEIEGKATGPRTQMREERMRAGCIPSVKLSL